MTLQDRMTNMKPYFRGIEMYNDGLIVKTVFPERWKVYGSEDARIKVAPSENNTGEYFFYANSNDTTYDEMFDLVEEVIKVNEETALKLKLLKDKIEEMKVLFADNDYSKLTTLKFVMEEEKPKAKKGGRKKAKEAPEKPTEATETTIEEGGEQ